MKCLYVCMCVYVYLQPVRDSSIIQAIWLLNRKKKSVTSFN